MSGVCVIKDAQLRKERLEADMSASRHVSYRSRYTVVLCHDSETAIWTIWKSPFNGRWYGTNDTDDRVIDAPTLKCAKYDLRMCNFPSNPRAALARAKGEAS